MQVACCFITLLSLFSFAHADEDLFENAATQFDKASKSQQDKYSAQAENQNSYWNDYKNRVMQKWSDGAIPERKIYVKYFDDESTRIRVNYESGEVIAETLLPKKDASESVAKEFLKNALNDVIDKDLNAKAPVIAKDEIPTNGSSVEQSIKNLIDGVKPKETETGTDHQERQVYRITFKLTPNYIKKRADKIRPLVEKWANKYNLDPAFVLAIIRQESSFNPRARSWVPAYGLMQIVPFYAGKEVMTKVTGKTLTPDAEFLYDPEKNIMVGTTYLQLLRDDYFKNVSDENTRRYLITCSYNWGPHRIKTAISKGQLSTRLPASDVYNKLRKIAPVETSNYLERVTQFTSEFQGKK